MNRNAVQSNPNVQRGNTPSNEFTCQRSLGMKNTEIQKRGERVCVCKVKRVVCKNAVV